ncbi:hypothetical protein D3C81_07710 [compost metagenome]
MLPERKFKVDMNNPFFERERFKHEFYRIDKVFIPSTDIDIEFEIEYKGTWLCTQKLENKIRGVCLKFPIEYEYFKKILKTKLYKGEKIALLRHFIPIGASNLYAIVDLYTKANLGLVLVTVQFRDEEQYKNFVVPDWFGVEVTGDSRYDDINLAMKPYNTWEV